MLLNITPWKHSFDLWQGFGPKGLSFHSFRATLHLCQILNILDWLKKKPICLSDRAIITLTALSDRISVVNQAITNLYFHNECEYFHVDIKTFNFSYFIFNSCLIIKDWSKAIARNFLYCNSRTILTLTTYVETLLHWENIKKDNKIDLCLWDYLTPSANSVMEDWLWISKEITHIITRSQCGKKFLSPTKRPMMIRKYRMAENSGSS